MGHRSSLACPAMPIALPDKATLHELAADERAGDLKGWLQRLHAWLFEGDIFASVASNDVPLRIHCTAEKFEDAAEQCFVPMQVFKAQLGLLHLLLVGQPTGFPCWTS